MAKKCKYELKDGRVLSYDEVRAFMLKNPPTPPKTGGGKPADMFGETKTTQRKRKRDSVDSSAAGLVTKGVSNEYSSINAEKANAAAQAEFDKIKSDTDLSTAEGVDEATEFAEELLNTPSKSDEANAVKVLGALILDKIRSHVFVQVNSGNKDLSGKLAELDRKVEFYKRSAAQQMAFANPSINPDELSIAIELIEGERKAMMERRAKSGKTVEEVVDDIANLKPNESEVDEAANTVTVPDKPKAERKPSISKERKDRGLAKVKSGLAKLQAKAPGALSVLSPEKIEGIKEIASGAVDLGIYSLEGIANYVKKQVGKLVDHKDVDSVLGKYWKESLKDISDNIRITTEIESLLPEFSRMLSSTVPNLDVKADKEQKLRDYAERLDQLQGGTAFSDLVDDYLGIEQDEKKQKEYEKTAKEFARLVSEKQPSEPREKKDRAEKILDLATKLDDGKGSGFTDIANAYNQRKKTEAENEKNESKRNAFSRKLTERVKSDESYKDERTRWEKILDEAKELDAIYGGTTYTDIANAYNQIQLDKNAQKQTEIEAKRKTQKAQRESKKEVQDFAKMMSEKLPSKPTTKDVRTKEEKLRAKAKDLDAQYGTDTYSRQAEAYIQLTNGLKTTVQPSAQDKKDSAFFNLAKAFQSGNGILNAFAKAIAIQNPNYDPSKPSSKLDKMLDIIKDKTQAETVVQTAIDNVLNQTILNPSLLKGLGLNKSDYVVSKSNPNGMTEEEFENFQRTVLRSQLEDAAAAFLDKGVFETDMTTAERPQRKKNPTTEAIREMVKEFYGKNFDNETLEQKIVEQFDIDPADAAKIAQNVRNVLNQKMGKRTQAKVRALVQDLNDGKDNFTMQQAISRMLTTQGVVTNTKVQNELIKFLGKKGMTKAHINKIIALSNLYSQMPSNVARQQVATAMQNIIANYDQTTAAFFMKAVFGNIMRNILGNPRTAILTSTLSMLKTVPFDLGRAFLLNPGRFVRSVQYRNNMATRKFMPGKSVYASIISGERHFSQRFELDELQPKKRDTEWQRVRDTSWKDVINAIKSKDNKSIATAIVKSLQEISLMGGWMNTTIKGKKVELSPVQLMYNLMGAADLFAWSNIAMMNNYMVAERMARNEGIMAGSQELQDRVGELLALGINDLIRIEKIVKDEITQMASAGIPVPKAYETDRKKQLLTEFADKDVLIQASFEAEKSMLLNKPSTLAGAYVYKALSRGSEIKDNASWVSATYKLLLGTLVAFHKVGLNVVGRRGKNIPFYNIVTASWPYEYEVGKDGSVQKRKYESGEARNRAKDMTREYVAGLVWAGATTAFTMSLIENLFDYDDLEDEEGNKLLNAEGQPIKVWKMNPNSSIRFHGEKEELIGNAKRIAPKNSIELTWVQDPDKRYINFNWFPESWYPTLYLMGDLSDNIRYTDNKLLKDKIDIAQRENFNPERILLTSAMGAFDASFTTPVELTKETAKLINYGKPVDAVANIFYSALLKPAADATSPRFADQVAQGVAYFNGREKSYVRMSIQNKDAKEGLTNLAQKWLSDTWWGEQIQGTADGKFSVVDAHGKPITYDPGDLLFVPSMIMEDMNFSFYDHVSKDKLFKLYLNEKGLFDESVIAPPSKVAGLQDYSEELKDKIKKEVPVMYGKLLEESYTSLADMEFTKRADLMKYIYRLSQYLVKTENGLNVDMPEFKASDDEAIQYILKKATRKVKE